MKQQAGYTLMEVLAVVVILGILAAVGSTYLVPTIERQRFEDTRREMDRLAIAITGDPSLLSGGVRTDYGYVGDVGAMPPDLSALVTNPGGYATWDGPYVTDDFSIDGSSSEYLRDGWGNSYSYSGGNTILSTGNGNTLTRTIFSSLDKLVQNSVSFAVIDIDNTPPGSTYRDSVRCVLTYPDGSGSYTSNSRIPDTGGYVNFDSIPIGVHTLRIIFETTGDIITRRVNVNPGDHYYCEIQFSDDIW